jgi:(2Fe-2S) ferredoxin
LPPYEHHVFICTNVREPGSARGSCTTDGKGEVLPAFQAAAKAAGLQGRVRINNSKCLDQCEHGPSVVVYPDAVWYGFVSAADVPEIVQSHLVGGQPVERLRLPDACIATATCPHKPRPAAQTQGQPEQKL